MDFINSTPGRWPGDSGNLYTSSTTERQGNASLHVKGDLIEVRMETPGFNPKHTTVQVRTTSLERKLVVEQSSHNITGSTTKRVEIPLPAAAGEIASPARFMHGVMTIAFKKARTDQATVDVRVEE